MNKVILLILLVSYISYKAYANQEFILAEDGDKFFKLIYLTPKNGEDLRVVFQVKLDNPIVQYKGAAAICFPTDDLGKTVEQIEYAFGIMFACLSVDVCGGYQLTPILYSSKLLENKSLTWAGNGKNFGGNNKGLYQNWSATFVDTVYAFMWDSDDDNDTHIPFNPEHFKCYFTFDEYYGTIRFDKDTYLGWTHWWSYQEH